MAAWGLIPLFRNVRVKAPVEDYRVSRYQLT